MVVRNDNYVDFEYRNLKYYSNKINNKNLILDYSNYISEIGSYGLNSPTNNKNLFFREWEFCKYCNTRIETTFNKGLVDIKTLPGANWHKSEHVRECKNCGWWQHSFHSYLEGESAWGFKDWQLDINSAILKKFETNSKLVPIEILRSYVQNNKDEIFNIHHKKMEELVASIFREHYNCEVEVVGKSNDGGVDLIVVNSDYPIMVQVKRRRSKNKTEPVKEIRDLLGATLLKGSRNCAFVTTANHFSSEAKKSTKIAIEKSIVDSFELFDYHRFFEMLNLYKKSEGLNYEHLLELKEDSK